MQHNDQNNSIHTAMTPQQKRFSPTSGGSLARYKELVVGDRGFVYFVLWELYSILFCDLPSIVGYILRRLTLSSFLRKCGRGLTIGRGTVIRQPHSLTIGNGVIIEDYATLDVRTAKHTPSINIGDHVFIGRNSIVAAKGGSITLGEACNISSNCRIATQSSVVIGKSVLIAAYAYIGPGNHKTENLDIPIMEQEMELKGGVNIGDNAWIGTRATILDGVTIGRNAIVGAHSLVIEDVPDNTVVAGTPAKVIKTRQ